MKANHWFIIGCTFLILGTACVLFGNLATIRETFKPSTTEELKEPAIQ